MAAFLTKIRKCLKISRHSKIFSEIKAKKCNREKRNSDIPERKSTNSLPK